MSAPWARRDKESDPAWQAFALYRDMGPERSCGKVAKALGKSTTLIERWCSTYSWVERAVGWDAHQDRVKREAQLAEVEAMGRRHAQQAQAYMQVLMAPAVKILAKLRNPEEAKAFHDELEAMPAIDAIALIARLASQFPGLMRAERLARGESTEHVEGTLTVEHVGQIIVEVGNEAMKFIPEDKQDAFREAIKGIAAGRLSRYQDN